jgi:heme exporter protein B
MRNYFKHIVSIFAKDLLLEFRTKETFVAVVIFALLIILTFNLGLDNMPGTTPTVSAGILWIAIIFGGIIGMNRIYSIETETGAINRILLTPVSRDAVFFAKALSNIVLMISVEFILLPTIIVLYNLSFDIFPMIFLSLFVITGISLVGTLFSVISIKTKTREVMLPILLLPILSPVLIAAVEASAAIIAGQTISDIQNWVALIIVFDAIFFVLAPLFFTYIVNE